MKSYCAYIHARPDGTPFYIGKASSHSRAHNLLRNEKHREVVATYGEENVVVTVIDCATEEVAFKIERALIAFFRQQGFTLTNLTSGGQGMTGYRHSDEFKKNRSAAMLGDMNPAKRLEVRAKISSKLLGDSNPMKRPEVRAKRSGDHNPCKRPDVRAKLSGENSVSKRPEVRAKISLAKKGQTHSAETRAKMSASQCVRRAREHCMPFRELPQATRI